MGGLIWIASSCKCKMCYFCLIILFVLSHISNCVKFNSMQIEDLTMAKCDNIDYSIMVGNVTVTLGNKPKVKITGSLSSQVDILDPITASVVLKRSIWGIWIPMPCENNLGSCTYKDLCDYGIPTNTTCPKDFIENNVPCRCPVPKGNYTIAPNMSFDLPKQTSLLSGKYKGTVTVTHNEALLSCYNVYFRLYDANDYNLYSVIQV